MDLPAEGNNEGKSLCEQQNAVAGSICDDLIAAICIDVACDMHHYIKSGVIPCSELMTPKNRREVYPSIAPTDEGNAEVHRNSLTEDQPSKRARIDIPLAESKIENHSNQTGESTTTHVALTRGSVNNTDIWGRIPSKEPKNPVTCPICGRQVGTLRFAPHLDKCMGIGTTVRAAASNGNRS